MQRQCAATTRNEQDTYTAPGNTAPICTAVMCTSSRAPQLARFLSQRDLSRANSSLGQHTFFATRGSLMRARR